MNVTTVKARTKFTPTLFGKSLFMHGESRVYDAASRMSKDYTGGSWKFMSDGKNTVMYMYPESPTTFHVRVASNFFEGTLSAKAFGIVCTLYSLNTLMFNPLPESVLENLVEKFHALRDYATTLPEAEMIFAAID